MKIRFFLFYLFFCQKISAMDETKSNNTILSFLREINPTPPKDLDNFPDCLDKVKKIILEGNYRSIEPLKIAQAWYYSTHIKPGFPPDLYNFSTFDEIAKLYVSQGLALHVDFELIAPVKIVGYSRIKYLVLILENNGKMMLETLSKRIFY